MTPNSLIEGFLRFKEHNQGRSGGTVVKYRGYLDRLATYAGEKSLLDLTREALEDFTGLHMHKQGLSPRSRRALVAAVRGLYAWLHKEGYVTLNPALIIPYPQAGRALPTPIGLKHAEKLLMQPDITSFIGIRDAAMLGVLIGCGLRISGLVSLNESSLIWMHEEEWERLVVKVTEKGKKERLVPVPDEARLLLRAYLGHVDLDDIDRALLNGDRVLFVSLRNRTISPDKYHGEARRISPRSVQDIIIQYGTAAGIPRAQLHPHAMRHLYGTELAEHDIDLLMRQALMGHEDPKSTEVYTQLAMRKLTQAVDKANPLRKMRTPVTDLLQQMRRSASCS